MSIAPVPYDRVQYTLSYLGTESVTIKEIKNWSEDEKEYSRNSDYSGIFASYSNNLEFVEDGKNFILFIYSVYGINAKIRLKKEERHPQTDAWTEVYSGYLDLSTFVENENSISVKLNSGGIEQLLKTRVNEMLEVDRLTTMDGEMLPELSTVNIPMDGRKIFLLSKMEDSTNSKAVAFATNSPYIAPIQNKTVSSDEHIKSTFPNFLDNTYFVGYNAGDDSKTFPQEQQFFYYENDRLKYLELTFDIDIDITFNTSNSSADQFIRIRIQKSKIGDDPVYPDPVEFYDIIYLNGNGGSGWQNIKYTNAPHPFVFELEADECLAVVWSLPQSVNNFKNYVNILKNDLLITEHSFFDPTSCRMILAHELGERLINIITNKKPFYSEALGRVTMDQYSADGIASKTGFANGLTIRGFERNDDDAQNKFKPLTTSFKDFMEAMRVTWKLGVGIEFTGRRERVRLEEEAFFFQPHVTIKLPNQVSNIKRSPATEYYFSSLEMGYEKGPENGGNYEESMGLDEYNGKATFTTVITGLKNIFKAISPYRTDSYGAEFARRKPKSLYPLADTRYDLDVFQFDLKRIAGLWFIRKWADDFEELPKGVYSPETAYNLRYSPANLLLKHGWEIASGFLKYPTDFIRYGSSTANSKLTTRLIGGVEISENGGESGTIIQNKDLPRAKFIPEWVSFSHICDFEVMQQVNGTSKILGREIPNFYGLVEYKINETDVERGYLFNLKPNGSGEWRVLKSNR